MRRLFATTVMIIAMLLAAATAPAEASTPPPSPGTWQPSAITGCWKSLLERHVDRRTVHYGGHTFVEFRSSSTWLRWCPGSGYKVVTWHEAWHPGRR